MIYNAIGIIYCPEGIDGLWINKAIAEVLNNETADKIRSGFCNAKINSRGVVYAVNKTGNPERQIGDQYKQQAEDVEKFGCFRLASTVREISNYYYNEADRIRGLHEV